MGDSPCEHPRLARTSAGDHRDEVALGGHRSTLIGIQISNQRIGVHAVIVEGTGRWKYLANMAYPRRRLHPGEEIAVDLRPHWWYYAKVAAVLVGSVAFGIATLSFDDGTTRTASTWAALALIALSTLWLIARYLRWARTMFVVTTERIIFRTGVVATSGIEITLDRVDTVQYRQSIFERMVGAGDLVIGAGERSGDHRFTDIARPRAVQAAIHERVEEFDRRRATPAAENPDVAAQLERFEAMLERGTLTFDEFQRQKERLLDE